MEGNSPEDHWYFDSTLGPIFTDGSCELGALPTHAHAAYAAVQIFDDGTVAKQVSGPVHKDLFQDSGMAEYLAWVHAARNVKQGKVIVVSDCANLVKDWEVGVKAASGATRPLGGIWKWVEDESLRGRVETTCKVKSHTSLSSLKLQYEQGSKSWQDYWWAVGNDRADAAANAARKWHGYSENDIAKAKAHNMHTRSVMVAIGNMFHASILGRHSPTTTFGSGKEAS